MISLQNLHLKSNIRDRATKIELTMCPICPNLIFANVSILVRQKGTLTLILHVENAVSEPLCNTRYITAEKTVTLDGQMNHSRLMETEPHH